MISSWTLQTMSLMYKDEIDRSHRVGKTSDSKPTRDIIVRFVSYRNRQKVLKRRKTMVSHNRAMHTSFSMYEDLTRKRSELAFMARKSKRDGIIKDTWTFDGKVFMKFHNDGVVACTRKHEIPVRHYSQAVSGNQNDLASQSSVTTPVVPVPVNLTYTPPLSATSGHLQDTIPDNVIGSQHSGESLPSEPWTRTASESQEGMSVDAGPGEETNPKDVQ